MILSGLCKYYYGKQGTQTDVLPIIADIGGIGKNQVKDLAGWGKVRVLTVNLYDDADIIDDASKLDKVEDGSLEGIYSSHLIEHFWWWECTDVLKLWHRKLKPNGRIKIRCPDMEWIMGKTLKAYKNKNLSEVWQDILFHNAYGSSTEPWHRYYMKEGQYHKNLLWEDHLAEELRHSGFCRIRRIYYFRHLLDLWPYDLRYEQYHGKIMIRDLVMEGYKP